MNTYLMLCDAIMRPNMLSACACTCTITYVCSNYRLTLYETMSCFSLSLVRYILLVYIIIMSFFTSLLYTSQGNVADEIMVEHLNKRPGGGGGASSHRSSRRQRPRSPSPMPPPQAPPTDNDKYKNHKPTQSNEAKNNGGLNATPSVAVTTDIEVIEIDSSSMINESNEEAMDLADALPPVTGSDKDPILPDPRPPPVPSVQVESNSVNDKKGELMLTNETLKDSLLPVSRKRTPSPTSITHLPPSKKFQRDPSQLSSSSSSLKPVNSTDSVGKSSTGKSPSPSPLTVPLTAPPTIRPSGLLSSASQVLNEEFKRKQLTENLKIKQLITKEIRKHSKSKSQLFCYHCFSN